MRKLIGIAALAACLSLVGAGEAKAAGPFNITFENFCDCITFRTAMAGGTAWMYGTWDWECTGNSFTLIHGLWFDRVMGTHPIDSTGMPAGFSITLDLQANGVMGHADIAQTFDGVNNILVANDTDYVRAAGACPGQPVNNGKPPLISQR